MSQGSSKRNIYRFGAFEVDRKEGLLRKNGVRIRIQPQPLAILLALLEHPGELVTREDLRNRLWPSDTFVDFEKGLNAGMTRLRYAIGDSATTPRYIVTEARLGYRFVAPVQHDAAPDRDDAGAMPSLANPPVAPPAPGAPLVLLWTRARPWLYLPVVALCLWFAAGIGRSGHHASQAVLQQITHDLGLSTEPAVSADGKLVAYASDGNKEGVLNIWVHQLAPGGKSVQLTNFDRDAHQPSFSPDGSNIVFRAEGDAAGLYVVPAIGGEPVRLSEFGRDPRYSPDGNWIAFWSAIDSTPNPDPSGEVFVMGARDGHPKKIGPALSGFPIWSADSQNLLVVKGRPEPEEDWWIVPLDGGAPRRTGAFAHLKSRNFTAEFGSMPQPASWQDDTVLFTARSGDTQNIWNIGLSSKDGRVQDPVERVTAGTVMETAPSVTADGQIFFASLTENIGIWSLSNGKVNPESEKLTRSTRHEITHSVTPDGRFVAYSALNAKDLDIHWKDLHTGKDAVLSSSPTPEWHPVLSRDGTHVAYTDRAPEGGIYTRLFPDGAAERVAKSRGYTWDWSADNSRLLYNKSKTEHDIWSVQFPSKTNSLFLHKEGYELYQPKFSPDDRWLAVLTVRFGSTGLYAVPLEAGLPAQGKPWVTIIEEKFWTDKPRWAPDGASISFVSHRDGYRCIWSQKIHPVTKRPIGSPAAVRHFHSARRSLANVPIRKLELELANDRMFVNIGELTGNIWSIRR